MFVPIDVETPQSPGWWLARLDKKRQANLPRLEKLDQYHRGDPPLPEGAANAQAAYQAFQKKARLNLAELIVGSLRERQKVRAIRTAVSDDEHGDKLAWQVFRVNGLEVEFADVLENMLALGDAYMMVAVDPGAGSKPTVNDVVITGEDPRQVVTIHDPVRQSRVLAGAKFFHDPEAGRDYAFLQVRGSSEAPNARVFVAYSENSSASKQVTFSESWQWDDDQGGADGIELPVPDVGIVRFRNRRGIGEFEPHIDVLDRINHMILQRMVIATMQAFKQRAVRGDLDSHYPNDYPDESLRGKKINYDEIFESDPGALWLLPAGAEIWESGQADIQGILSAVTDDLKHLAAVTRRPMSIFAPDNQSAAGADLTADGLIFATEDRNMRAGQALAQVIYLAFLFMGDEERAKLEDVEVDWMPVARHSLTGKGSAAQQARAGGMSNRGVLEHVWQLTPAQIDRELADESADLMNAEAFSAGGQEMSQAEQDKAAADAFKAKAEAIGMLIRAGADPDVAAELVGLKGLKFTGAIPVSLRPKESDAARLEDA